MQPLPMPPRKPREMGMLGMIYESTHLARQRRHPL